MLHLLPTELFVHIVETTAHEYRFSDRRTVINLAMSCRTVYDIVSPILHHTLIVTDRNAEQLESLISNAETRALAERILSHVHCFHNRSRIENPFDPHLLVNIESVETWSSSIFGSLAHAQLKRVYTNESNLLEATCQLAPEAMRAVTHVSGFLPMFIDDSGWDSFFADPSGWMQSLLKKVPVVTHLGLTHDYPWKGDYRGSIALYDYEAVGTAIRTALRDRPSLQCIAIRTCGLPVELRRADLETILRNIGDPRVKIWFDMRPQTTWDEHVALRVLDVQEDRSLWSEARPL